MALGAGAGRAAAGAAGKGIEFSHWIPNRMGGPRNIWNGNFVTSARHYFHDPYRYPKGWRELGNKWPFLLQQLDRIPNVIKGMAGGALWGAASSQLNDPCSK